MKDALQIFVEIVLAVVGAVFFGSLTIAAIAFGVGCLLFGSCWSWLGWRKRRAARSRPRP
jgi:hypothetical protein